MVVPVSQVGQKVIDLCKGEIIINSSSTNVIKDKVVIYAHHSNDNKITKSVYKQLENWYNCGWSIVVVDSSDDKKLPWPNYVSVLHKPNIGFDFGSWSVALHSMPHLLDVKKVLFANSGVIGPFWSFSNLLRDFLETDADFWGLTTNSDINWHIQTYWFGFSNGALKRLVMKDFWESIKVEPNKRDVIVNYEVGISQLILSQGWPIRVVFPYQAVGVPDGIDTGTYNWDRLLDMGLPFVKRRVLHWTGEPMARKIVEYGKEAIELVMEGLSENINAK